MGHDATDPRHAGGSDLARRDFLKVGAGFTLALTLASTLPGCSGAPKAPAQGLTFLLPADAELFSALAPVVVLDLTTLDAAERARRTQLTLANIDATCAALDAHSRGELRKLFDLLAIGPLRYVLTGVGAWKEATPEKLAAFLERWRGSSLATLNSGGNVLVRLVSGSYYVIPETFAAVGYPGPLAAMYQAVNA
jgi:hypothetical protein